MQSNPNPILLSDQVVTSDFDEVTAWLGLAPGLPLVYSVLLPSFFPLPSQVYPLVLAPSDTLLPT